MQTKEQVDHLETPHHHPIINSEKDDHVSLLEDVPNHKNTLHRASIMTDILQANESTVSKGYKNCLSPIKARYREYFGEFLGTLMVVLLGDGSVAQRVFSDTTWGDYLAGTMAWAEAVMFGVLICFAAGAKGHMNPAVTTALALFRGFPKHKILGYIVAQMLGGFCGAMLLYANYKQAYDWFDPEKTMKTANTFSTYPQSFLNTKGQVTSEIVTGAVLIIMVYSLIDFDHEAFFPLGIFHAINCIGCGVGYLTGWALNPARDLAPRIAARIVGYGSFTFTTGNHYSWVPAVVPFIAMTLGSVIYDTLIYEGEDSPMNQPYFGFEIVFDNKTWRERKNKEKRLDSPETSHSAIGV